MFRMKSMFTLLTAAAPVAAQVTTLAGEETLKLEVQVEYLAALQQGDAEGEGLGPTPLPGRRLSLPVQLLLQPAVQARPPQGFGLSPKPWVPARVPDRAFALLHEVQRV